MQWLPNLQIEREVGAEYEESLLETVGESHLEIIVKSLMGL